MREIPTPAFILNSASPNIGRLTAVYQAGQEKVRHQRYRRPIDHPIRSGFAIPKATPWRPPVITTVPNTPVVVKALHTGVLRLRLELGLERIYISEVALLRAPSCAQRLIDLASKFPDRLVIVPINADTFHAAGSSQFKRALAMEFACVGHDLTDAYEEEFGFDRLWNRNVLDDVHCLRVGNIPRGVNFLIGHEQFVPESAWHDLDMDGVQHIMQRAQFERKRQSDKSMKLLVNILSTASK